MAEVTLESIYGELCRMLEKLDVIKGNMQEINRRMDRMEQRFAEDAVERAHRQGSRMP
jgi:hypothetical protein